MEQIKIETNEDLVLALQKIHECQTIYMNAMAKYDDTKMLEDFETHCDCIIHIIKERISDDINSRIEYDVESKYDDEILSA